MADSIDKSVTDTKTTVEVPGAGEIIQDQKEKIEHNFKQQLIKNYYHQMVQ